MILTYKYRLLPTKRQHSALAEICEAQRQLYNAALEERIDCYRKTRKTRTYIDQCKALTICRREHAEMGQLPVNVQRWTLKRLDEAFSAFFRRFKAKKEKAGFPRFRGKGWWESFGFGEFKGIRFDGKRLWFSGLPGGLRVHLHRPLPDDADIRSCIFRREGRRWFVCLQLNTAVTGRGVENQIHRDEGRPGNIARERESAQIGIDLGLKAFAYCTDGVVIPTPQLARRAARELRRRQRALTRCKRGSNRRHKVRERVARLQRKVANARSTWLHQQSAAMVNRASVIVVEDLKIKNMLRSAKGTADAPGKNVAAKAGLNRSIADASWARFIQFLDYKAERAGVQLIKVDPRLTSQKCSGCGVLVPKSLAVRTHSCPSCGLVIDRDWNAAHNILRTGIGPGPLNVAQRGERAAGNTRRVLVR